MAIVLVAISEMNFMPILHYALVLHFGKVCDQEHEKNATGLRFYPNYSVI